MFSFLYPADICLFVEMAKKKTRKKKTFVLLIWNIWMFSIVRGVIFLEYTIWTNKPVFSNCLTLFFFFLFFFLVVIKYFKNCYPCFFCPLPLECNRGIGVLLIGRWLVMPWVCQKWLRFIIFPYLNIQRLFHPYIRYFYKYI